MERLLLIPGSLRAGATSTAVLRTACAVAPPGLATVLCDGLDALPHFNPDDDREGTVVDAAVAALRAQVAAADAVLVCTPEYAGALPGAFKNLLEWTVGDAGTYRKPVAWINAAGVAAPTGAADAHDSLRRVLAYVHATSSTRPAGASRSPATPSARTGRSPTRRSASRSPRCSAAWPITSARAAPARRTADGHDRAGPRAGRGPPRRRAERGPPRRRACHARGVAAPLARDLTDPAENQAVLDAASALAAGETTGEAVAQAHGAAVAAEADAAYRSRARLVAADTAVHLGVVWAMYGETGRMATREEHPHGEDLVRVKARQLDWLTDGTAATWSVVAVDDGCPDTPSSAEAMRGIVASEGHPASGHRGIAVLRLADVLADGPSIGPAFDRLTSTRQSRKGGSILAGLAHALREPVSGRHVVAYTDADLSADLAQLGALAAPLLSPPSTGSGDAAPVAALGQRYGLPGAVLVKPGGPVSEPLSTGGKPDKVIVLLRHAVRATLIPQLAHVLDTQAGFKAFDAAALRPVLARMSSFDETFDVELLIHLAQAHGAAGIAVEPVVFTEDFAATNFPSVEPGARHLAMVEQVVALHDRFIAPTQPPSDEAAALRRLVRGLDVPAYVRLIEGLRAEDLGDDSLFDRRWPAAHLAALAA